MKSIISKNVECASDPVDRATERARKLFYMEDLQSAYLEYENLWKCIVGTEVERKLAKAKVKLILCIDPITRIFKMRIRRKKCGKNYRLHLRTQGLRGK